MVGRLVGLSIVVFFAMFNQVQANDKLVITFGSNVRSLHLPIGDKRVAIEPAFEDYAYMLYDLCDGIGLDSKQCNILPMNGAVGRTAIATVFQGSRLIIYGRDLSPTIGYEGAMGVIAHELGHHVCGHLDRPSGQSGIQDELVADKFAGAAMRMSKMTLSQTMFMAAVLDERPSSSHPGRSEREIAIAAGWNDPASGIACR